MEVTKLKSVSFRQYLLKIVFGESALPGSSIAKNITRLNFFLDIFPRDQLSLIVHLINAELKRMILPAKMRWDMIKCFGFLFYPCMINLRHVIVCGI